MKGIVFTEFLALVEEKFGLETVDEIIEKSDLASEGVYTAIGTYEFSEMLSLLTHLSEKTSLSIDTLLYVYAEHFFEVLKTNYSKLIETYSDPMALLASIENHIHVEVRKIYPDAELPYFEVLERTENKLVLEYTSSRAMYNFGLGLMHKTFEYFGQKADIKLDKLKSDGSKVNYTIIKISD
jgi:hypothetical protein